MGCLFSKKQKVQCDEEDAMEQYSDRKHSQQNEHNDIENKKSEQMATENNNLYDTRSLNEPKHGPYSSNEVQIQSTP